MNMRGKKQSYANKIGKPKKKNLQFLNLQFLVAPQNIHKISKLVNVHILFISHELVFPTIC